MATASSTENDETTEVLAKPPFLRRVRIRGYKSIAFCDVTLSPLTVLVGRNASGKSNFLDAIAFLRDVMDAGASEAAKRRGGWSALLCRSSLTQKIGIEIEVGFTCDEHYRGNSHNGSSSSIPPGNGTNTGLTGVAFKADYSLEFTARSDSPPVISREKLVIYEVGTQRYVGFELSNGIFSRQRAGPDSLEPLPSSHSTDFLEQLERAGVSITRPDRPFLNMSGMQPYIDLGNGLRQMGFYNFQPNAIRTLQKPNLGWLMENDGRNLASTIENLKLTDRASVDRVRQYLSAIVEQVENFDAIRYGEYETVRFRMYSQKNSPSLEFDAASMSDGTLRAIAALTAVFQNVPPHGSPSVVGIEEPESALHPAAMRALVAALDEATLRTQVLITTHSADLLDAEEVNPQNIRVVQMIDGQTIIGPVDEANVEIVGRQLSTLGGLERDNQLEPDLVDQDRQQQLRQAREEPSA